MLLANSTKLCYTYDSLGRVTKRTTKNLSDVTLYEENYSYDAAGNIVGDTANVGFTYDTNNRLVMFNGRSISYDLDGNMTDDYCSAYSYDSANRLLHVDGHMYTYNAEDVRIRNHSAEYDTTYTYDTNRKLSRLLTKTTNGVTTKYVYGHGLISEDKESVVKVYHFDNRGSTIAITDILGTVTDTFKYDTYGKLLERTGDTYVVFGYNGRDGVITDNNGLIYMRARYYSPVMRRFINADIIHGTISDSTSLNRYSYVNGNPVSFVDPFGLSKERECVDCESFGLYLSSISPWGNPNTHVTHFDKYWIERWYGPDGRAVRDVHWTDHGNSGIHTNPHEQTWDWSNPEKPQLPHNPNPPSNPLGDPPTSEYEEPWYQEESKKTSEESSKDNKNESKQVSNGGMWGNILLLVVSGVALIWLVGNDITGIGTADDAAIPAAAGACTFAMQAIFG